MTNSKHDYSMEDSSDDHIELEFRNFLSSLFCSCLKELDTSNSQTSERLFRLTEIEGRTLAAAAETLGVDVEISERMLIKTRCDVVVLMVLGLCRPPDKGSLN